MTVSLNGFSVAVRIPIRWADMDAYGHVNNTVFFRFFEEARIAYLERCGLAASKEATGIGAILHSTTCRFRRPVEFPDEIVAGARVISTTEDRFTHEYQAFSIRQDTLVAEGTGIIVGFDYRRGTKAPLPEEVRTSIKNIESGNNG